MKYFISFLLLACTTAFVPSGCDGGSNKADVESEPAGQVSEANAAAVLSGDQLARLVRNAEPMISLDYDDIAMGAAVKLISRQSEPVGRSVSIYFREEKTLGKTLVEGRFRDTPFWTVIGTLADRCNAMPRVANLDGHNIGVELSSRKRPVFGYASIGAVLIVIEGGDAKETDAEEANAEEIDAEEADAIEIEEDASADDGEIVLRGSAMGTFEKSPETRRNQLNFWIQADPDWVEVWPAWSLKLTCSDGREINPVEVHGFEVSCGDRKGTIILPDDVQPTNVRCVSGVMPIMVVTGILDLELPLKKDARLSKDGINVVVDGVKDVDESYDYKFGITWDHGLNEDEKQEFDRIFQPDTKQEDAVRSLIKLSDRLTAYTIVDMAYTTDECNGISSKQTWRTSGYFCARNIRGEIRVPKGVDCRALLKLGRVRFVNVAFEIELKCSDKK